MNIAYLMNTYPITSTTFVRREIEALEQRGLTIKRYAAREWQGPLVDPLDIAEKSRTDRKAIAQGVPTPSPPEVAPLRLQDPLQLREMQISNPRILAPLPRRFLGHLVRG